MRIFISADIEGIAGVVTGEQTHDPLHRRGHP